MAAKGKGLSVFDDSPIKFNTMNVFGDSPVKFSSKKRKKARNKKK